MLVAEYLDRTRFRRVWTIVTLAPLACIAVLALPIDWFAPYRVTPRAEVRVYHPQTTPGGVMPARAEFRLRAQRLEPLFGAVAGLRYAVMRSPDRMHSFLSRVALERFDAGTPELRGRYLRIAGCANVAGALPPAMIVPRAVGARSLHKAVQTVEDPRFDERMFAAAPPALHGYVSRGRLHGYAERSQTIHLDVEGPALLMVNQFFFSSWVARAGERELTPFR